jgi:hypothetical protein
MGFGQFIGENGVADVDFSSHVDSEMAGFLLILQVVFFMWTWFNNSTCNFLNKKNQGSS